MDCCECTVAPLAQAVAEVEQYLHNSDPDAPGLAEHIVQDVAEQVITDMYHELYDLKGHDAADDLIKRELLATRHRSGFILGYAEALNTLKKRYADLSVNPEKFRVKEQVQLHYRYGGRSMAMHTLYTTWTRLFPSETFESSYNPDPNNDLDLTEEQREVLNGQCRNYLVDTLGDIAEKYGAYVDGAGNFYGKIDGIENFRDHTEDLRDEIADTVDYTEVLENFAEDHKVDLNG